LLTCFSIEGTAQSSLQLPSANRIISTVRSNQGIEHSLKINIHQNVYGKIDQCKDLIKQNGGTLPIDAALVDLGLKKKGLKEVLPPLHKLQWQKLNLLTNTWL
jgi:hypothetical protein